MPQSVARVADAGGLGGTAPHRWFETQSPPYKCPMSNVELCTIELFPLTRRDHIMAVASAPEAPVAGKRDTTGWPSPLPYVIAVLHVTAAVVAGAQWPGSWTHPSPKNPLLNCGHSYDRGFWRPLSSLFTNVNPAFASANAILVVFLGRTLPQTTLLVALTCSALGAFAAGVAFPDCLFAEGFVTSAVLASRHLSASGTSPLRRGALVAVLTSCVCVGLTRYMNLLSHVVALVSFWSVIGTEYKRAGAFAHLFGVSALCGLYSARVQVPGLWFLAPEL